MIYDFHCYGCGADKSFDCQAFQPPLNPFCDCKRMMARVYNAQFNTNGCKDHDHVPEQFRVADGNRAPSKAGAERKEAAFRKHIESRKHALREDGNRGTIRHTHSVPADLYHGKIRETGDRNYWNDSSNLKRHSSTRVG